MKKRIVGLLLCGLTVMTSVVGVYASSSGGIGSQSVGTSIEGSIEDMEGTEEQLEKEEESQEEIDLSTENKEPEDSDEVLLVEEELNKTEDENSQEKEVPEETDISKFSEKSDLKEDTEEMDLKENTEESEVENGKDTLNEYSFTKDYFIDNLNIEYISGVDKFQMVNGITTKLSIFDGNYVDSNDDLDSVFNDWNNVGDAYIASTGGVVPVFDVNEDSDYYISLVDTMFNDSGYVLQDYDFAMNNLKGEVLEDAVLEDNGIGYIPKEYFTSEIATVQVQIMQVSKTGTEMTSNVVVESVEGISDISSYGASIPYTIEQGNVFDFRTTVSVEPGLDLSKYVVKVNEVPISSSEYSYNSESGKLVLEMDSSTIATISIEEADSTEESFIETFSQARATNSQLPHIPGNILGVPSDLYDRLDNGEQPVYTGTVGYNYATHDPNMFKGYIAWSANLDSSIKNLADQIKNGGVNISPVQFNSSDLNYLLKFSEGTDLQGWTFDKVFNVILKCGHISDPFTDTPDTSRPQGKVKYYLRVIDYDEGTKTITVGILTDRTHTQSGVGVFRVSAPMEKRVGTFEVHKVSANGSITDGNGNYSLYGAVYGVYTDEACTKLVGYITTDSSGVAKATVDVGTYYVKEYQASPGYLLDPNVYRVEATAS